MQATNSREVGATAPIPDHVHTELKLLGQTYRRLMDRNEPEYDKRAEAVRLEAMRLVSKNTDIRADHIAATVEEYL